MNIIGGDFNLKKDGDNFTLYIMGKNGKAKLGGYFTSPYYAFKWVLHWRLSKKYPHKQDPKEIAKEIKRYRKITKDIDDISKLVYKPIVKLNNDVNGIRGLYDKLGSKDRFNTSRASK